MKTADADKLCRAAGLDPKDQRTAERRRTLLKAVTEAIGLYRHEVADQRQAPRQANQQAALERLQQAIAALATQLDELDDASREQLTLPRVIRPRVFRDAKGRSPDRHIPGGVRKGIDWFALRTQLEWWNSTAQLAIADLETQEKRGKPKNTARRTLLSLLGTALTTASADRDDADPGEFFQIACAVAGFRLSERQAQVIVAQLVP